MCIRDRSKEVLDVGENAGRVGDQSLAADEVQLIDAELCKPVTHVDGVQAYLYGSPWRVHRRRHVTAAARLNERQLLERRRRSVPLGARLRVVRQRTRHWITHDDDETNRLRHLPHSTCNIPRY